MPGNPCLRSEQEVWKVRVGFITIHVDRNVLELAAVLRVAFDFLYTHSVMRSQQEGTRVIKLHPFTHVRSPSGSEWMLPTMQLTQQLGFDLRCFDYVELSNVKLRLEPVDPVSPLSPPQTPTAPSEPVGH